jgi:hypothetical protein
MEKNKTGKYFKYAFREIILVVIGILIALQINNLNEQRKENLQEKVILKQLRDEFKSNLNQLNSKIEIRNVMLTDFEDCLNYFTIQKVDNDSLFEAKLSSLLLPLTFDPIQNELVSSGNIKIIKNNTLKKLLTNWTSDVYQLREVEKLFETHYTNSIIPYFEKTGIVRNIVKRFWEDKNKTSFLMEKQNGSLMNLKSSSISVNTTSLLKSAQLESIISSAYSMNLASSYESQTLNKHINEILRLLNREIKK